MADKARVVLKFNDDDIPPPKKPTLWERANTPIIDLRKQLPSVFQPSPEFEKNHPWIAGPTEALTDTVSGLTSPTSLGLMAATAGLGTLGAAGRAALKVGAGAMVGHGGYQAVKPGATPYERAAGVIEAGLGGLGLRSGPHAPAAAGPDLKSVEGLRVALKTIENHTGPIGPEELKLHQAIDEATLRSRKGTLATDIFGKEGRPDLSEKNLTTGKLESKFASVVDIAKAKSEALKLTDADKRATQNSAATDISLQDAVEADRAKKHAQTVKEIEAGFKANADANKGLAGAEATKAKVDAQGIAQEAKNLNARDKYLSTEAKATDKATADTLKQREADAAQEARNLNARDKFQNKLGKDQTAAEIEDAKRADAAQQAQTLAALRENLTETVPPSSISETVSGPGENGGTARATIRRVAPEPPPEAPAPEPEVHSVDYFKKIDAIRAAKDAGYDPKEWDIKGGRNKWNIVKRGVEPEPTPQSTVPPTPDTATDGGESVIDPNTVTRRFKNKATAAAVAKEAGMDVHQIGPRQYELRPRPSAPVEPEVTPQSPAELLAPRPEDVTPLPSVGSPSTSMASSVPEAPVKTLDQLRGNLSPEEFRRYMDVQPSQGMKRTPADLAEFRALHAKMTAPLPQAEPMINAAGEAEPTLPGVEPTVNPEAAPVADLPLTLDGGKANRFSETNAGADALGSLFDDAHGEGNLPEGLNPSGNGTMVQGGAAPIRSSAPVADPGFAPPSTLEDAQASYGRIKAAKAGGAFIPEEVRSSAGEELQGLEKAAKPQDKLTPDSAVQELQNHVDDPATSPAERTLLQRLQDNLKSKGIMVGGDPANKGKGSTLSMFGAGQGPNIKSAFANNGFDSADVGEKVLSGTRWLGDNLAGSGEFINNLHRSTMLSPYSVAKKATSDAWGLATAGIDRPSAVPSLLRNTFHPETVEDFKTGYNSPTKGNEENSGLQDIFSSKKNPLGIAGRTMAGLATSTKGIIERSGFSPEEAAGYTNTKTPSRAITSKLYELLNLPGMNYLSPFSRIGVNLVENGYERSPLGLIDLLTKKNDLSGPEAATIMKKAATGIGAGTAAYNLAPEDFVKDHPLLMSTGALGTGSPLGPAIMAGLLLKSSGKHRFNDTVSRLLSEMPGMKLAEDAMHPGQMLRSHLASYTNIARPFAEALDPSPKETSKGLEGIDYYTAPMRANVPGFRNQLSDKAEKKTPVKLVF